MRVLVVGAFQASSQYAHAINTVSMAQGFARLGHEVSLICRQADRGIVSENDLREQYALSEPITWVQIPLRWLGRPVGEGWRFALRALRATLRFKPDFVYARNFIFPALSCRLGIATAAESHAGPEGRRGPFHRLVKTSGHRNFRAWVTIAPKLAEDFRLEGVPAEKLLVLPDAVDLNLFGRPDRPGPSPYDGAGPHVAYAGHLYDYKGIPTVLDAAARLPEAQFHLVGGWEDDIARQKQRARRLGLDNVTFHGLRPRPEVPKFLWHADVLLLPPSARHPSAQWTSPVKLGEYLASGTPVVSTDIPALRHWLSDEETEFARPDDAEALAVAIRNVLGDEARGEELRKNGLKRAAELSYEKRAQCILNHCGL